MFCMCHNNRTFASAITQCTLFMFWTGDQLPIFLSKLSRQRRFIHHSSDIVRIGIRFKNAQARIDRIRVAMRCWLVDIFKTLFTKQLIII